MDLANEKCSAFYWSDVAHSGCISFLIYNIERPVYNQSKWVGFELLVLSKSFQASGSIQH